MFNQPFGLSLRDKFMTRYGLFSIALLLITFAPARAQYTDRLGGNWANPASATITNIIMDRYARRRLAKNLAERRASTNSIVTALPMNDAEVRFRPTGTQLKTAEIANIIGPGNPQVHAIMTALLQDFDKNARTVGKPNDLALALSFFFATNASIYHGEGQPSDPSMLELRDTIARALVEANALSGVTDRQKQEMYETLVLFTGFALAAYEEGKQSNNSESMRIGQQLAGQNLESVTGISPDKINFTGQGLIIEREPAVVTPEEARASDDQSNAQRAAAQTSVNAGKLVLEFEGNEVRAIQMYGGKRIRVNGTVNSIDVLRDGRVSLTFHSPAGGYANTRCYFNKSQSTRLAQVREGQEGIVEGTVRGFGSGSAGRGYVELDDCLIP